MGNVKDIETERKNQLKKTILSNVNSNTDIVAENFSSIIYQVVSNGYITEEELRNEFGLTAGAVDRWMLNKNLPQIDVMKIILNWILKKIC